MCSLIDVYTSSLDALLMNCDTQQQKQYNDELVLACGSYDSFIKKRYCNPTRNDSLIFKTALFLKFKVHYNKLRRTMQIIENI